MLKNMQNEKQISQIINQNDSKKINNRILTFKKIKLN